MRKKLEKWNEQTWKTKDLVKVCGKNWAMTSGIGRDMPDPIFSKYKVSIAQDAGSSDCLRIEDKNGEVVEIFLSEQIKEMITKGYQKE